MPSPRGDPPTSPRPQQQPRRRKLLRPLACRRRLRQPSAGPRPLQQQHPRPLPTPPLQRVAAAQAPAAVEHPHLQTAPLRAPGTARTPARHGGRCACPGRAGRRGRADRTVGNSTCPGSDPTASRRGSSARGPPQRTPRSSRPSPQRCPALSRSPDDRRHAWSPRRSHRLGRPRGISGCRLRAGTPPYPRLACASAAPMPARSAHLPCSTSSPSCLGSARGSRPETGNSASRGRSASPDRRAPPRLCLLGPSSRSVRCASRSGSAHQRARAGNRQTATSHATRLGSSGVHARLPSGSGRPQGDAPGHPRRGHKPRRSAKPSGHGTAAPRCRAPT
mmetsp:Transcript_16994/g.59446  ORF Transcript_16994/g.59446 Transcript_16994/m.59446 type:complete len:334 (-) Transcript_16994:489-1490(-)